MKQYFTSLWRISAYFIAFTVFSFNSFAQLSINESVTKDSLARLITGNGIAISNVTVQCNTTSSGRGYGSYIAGTNSIGLNTGLLLTTGRASDAKGPNNHGGKTSSENSELNNNDTYKKLLENYASNKTVKEYCLYSFDIVPQGDSIMFDYTFASEEYNEYVDSDYNDVFGFFISGPGIVGETGAGGRRNIAKIPNTNIPVSINTVNNGVNNNSCTNCAYYQNNPNNSAYLQYDGHTKNLTAYSKVIPCSTYKLELIVADCGDKEYDSGVFIEKIRSNAAVVTSSTVAGIPDAIEGCNPGIYTFTRPLGNNTTNPLMVNYWLSGTAVNGVDYAQIGNTNPILPRSITIPAGSQSTTLQVNFLSDGINEVGEFVRLSLFNANCPAASNLFVTLPVRDSIFTSITPKLPSVCEGAPITFNATNGLQYVWTGNTSSSSSAIYNLTTSQNVSVTAKVGACAETKSTFVTVNPLPIAKVFDTPTEPCLGGMTELKMPNSQSGIKYELVNASNNAQVGAAQTGNGSTLTMITENITSAKTYYINASNPTTSCFRNNMGTITVNPPAKPNKLANNNESRTCLVGGNSWVEFTVAGSDRAIASINPNNQFLGWVTITEYVNGNTQNIQACGTSAINQPQFTTAALGRNWVVAPEYKPTSNVDVRLYFSEADFLATKDVANINANTEDDLSTLSSLGMTKYTGPYEDNSFANNCGYGLTTLHTQSGNGTISSLHSGFTASGRFARFGVSSFSELWLHGFSTSDPSPLPVVLKEFDVNCEAEGVAVSWATQSEVNNEYFSVMYSQDGSDWKEIAQVEGMGNSNQLVTYNFIDKGRRSGIGYYKLVQYDYNGTSEAFPMASSNCSFASDIQISAYPNPTNGNFSVQISGEVNEVRLTMFDMTGKKVYAEVVNANTGDVQMNVSVNHFAAGAYILKVEGEGLEGIKPIKIIKQ